MLFESSFKRLIFALLKQINVCSQSLRCVSFRHIRYSTTKFASIREVNGQLFRCFLLASWQVRRLSYQAPVLHEVFSLMRVSRRIYTGGIPKELSVYAHMMSRPESGPDSSQHLKLSSARALLRLFVCLMPKEFNFMACFEVIILKNRIERAFKLKMVKISMKKKVQQMTFHLF